VVPDPRNPRYSYGGGKIACELMAMAWQHSGALDRMIIARPHNVYGEDSGYEHVIPEFCSRMEQIVHEYPDENHIAMFEIQGTGHETRSFCYISDCIDQLVLLLQKSSGGIYHVGTMDERTITDVASGVAACYGREIKIIPGTLQKGSTPRRLPDTTKIQALGNGYRPQVSFDEGLARTVAWYREHPSI
jgi:dTDP-glucose 4,6-dehydratase/UDP-glucose 4-epimerase